MRFNCDKHDRWGKDWVERYKTWHMWFAWYPVKIKPGECRWLEWVERIFDQAGSVPSPITGRPTFYKRGPRYRPAGSTTVSFYK